jgi:hypothetical protein
MPVAKKAAKKVKKPYQPNNQKLRQAYEELKALRAKVAKLEKLPVVWVIMGNDYPDSVFGSGKSAGKYITLKKNESIKQGKRINWRAYTFPVQK